MRLTWLYAPGDRPDLFPKAVGSGADVVILDLEDAVAAIRKSLAREAVGEFLRAEHRVSVHVRINALDSPWIGDDIDILAGSPGLAGIRVPKVESADDIPALMERWRGVQQSHAGSVAGSERAGLPEVHVLLESALGVEAAYDIARSAPEVAGIGLGEADLSSELGLPWPSDQGLAWARSRIVIAARAAGLAHPAMSVYPHLDDEIGLGLSCRVGRAMGFVGRAAIHPRQLPVIERAFRPSPEERRRAEELLAGLDPDSMAVNVLSDGRFVDRAMVDGARLTLALAERTSDG